MKKLIILGAGENGILAKNIIEQDDYFAGKYNLMGFLDDDLNKKNKIINNLKVLGQMDDWSHFDNSFFTTPFVASPKTNHFKKKNS